METEHTFTRETPDGLEYALTVVVESTVRASTHEYGADADGRRGRLVTDYEVYIDSVVDTDTNEVRLTDDEADRITAEIIEEWQAQEMPDPDDLYEDRRFRRARG